MTPRVVVPLGCRYIVLVCFFFYENPVSIFLNSIYQNIPKKFDYFQKAEAQLAYELQAAKIQQRIKQEELQIQVKKRQ